MSKSSYQVDQNILFSLLRCNCQYIWSMWNTCRRTRESVFDKMASLNINQNSKSCVLIIIIGYRRLARSIFTSKSAILTSCWKARRSRVDFAKINERMIKVIVIHILMQQKTKSYWSSPRKRMFLQQVPLYIAISKSTREL